jgi:hypothetical protein
MLPLRSHGVISVLMTTTHDIKFEPQLDSHVGSNNGLTSTARGKLTPGVKNHVTPNLDTDLRRLKAPFHI